MADRPWMRRVRGSAAFLKKRAVALCLIFCSVALAATLVMRAFDDVWGVSPEGGGTPRPDGDGLVIDQDAVPYKNPRLQIGSGDGSGAGIKIPGYSPGFMAAGNRLKIALENAESNPCYFIFEIVLNDTGESLYLSEAVPPGMAVTEQTLSRPLEAGEYPLTIKITTLSLADQKPMNGASVSMMLSVYGELEEEPG